MTTTRLRIESSFLARFKEGDTEAFTYFFNTYWEELYTVAYRHVQDEGLSKDVVQEVFIHIWERKHLINTEHGSLKPYLFKAVKNKVLNHYASEKVRRQVLDQVMLRMESMAHEEQYNPDTYRKLEKIVDEAVATLPPLVQTVYLMKNDNYSIKQIAQTLNIAEQTVKNYLTDARKKLQQDLTQRFADHDLILIFLISSSIVYNYLT
ncbi:RNA polymerase sigma factor [Sphingobacterium spiritivorum]|uniref:RNA polymerase sigma factor n=1 Tax=Sphingobacterium spiritivorum TaxID=258 RepID=UPI003DA42F6E